MVDLLIPGQTPGIKEAIVDLYGKPEILFFGPDGTHVPPTTYLPHHPQRKTMKRLTDTVCFYFYFLEGTADLMDWAAIHARARGATTWWKSFTTGKSAEALGGVPHDTYGMTSLSVRQYVLGLYAKLGLKEREITKVQTGGPDGDLGSSAFFLSPFPPFLPPLPVPEGRPSN